jgi:alkanesulfonate monooxygenase SsuD/methylene tetrahydromethanopterin reductase-like flavin-dependent oxidoreductase (luciferase family)
VRAFHRRIPLRKGLDMARLKIGFIPIEGGHFYREALEEVIRAETLGFDSVWMEEHHGVKDHYWPSPLPVSPRR